MMKNKNPEIKIYLDLIKKKSFLKPLNIKDKFFKIFTDEREIEIPYLLSRFSGQKKILEVGISLADYNLIKTYIDLKKITKVNLFALDIIDVEKTIQRFKKLDLNKNFIFLKGDATKKKFKNKFDMINLISTLEHIGLDRVKKNKQIKGVFQRLSKRGRVIDNNEDYNAIKNLSNSLHKGGSMIVTVPFGTRKILYSKDSFGLYAYFREYSLNRIKKIIKYSGLDLVDFDAFEYKTKKWIKIKHYNNYNNIKLSKNAAVRSVACFELRKLN